MDPLTITTLLTVFPTLLTALANNPLMQGWAAEVAGGLTGTLLDGTIEGLSRDRRRKLNEAALKTRLKSALQRALTSTLAELCHDYSPRQQAALKEALATWSGREEVQDQFTRLLDPRQNNSVDLDRLTQLFNDVAPARSLKGITFDVPAFVAWLAGCFHAAVQADPALSSEFELPALEKLVQQAIEQGRLLEMLAQNTALSARIQALQLESSQRTAQATEQTAKATEQTARATEQTARATEQTAKATERTARATKKSVRIGQEQLSVQEQQLQALKNIGGEVQKIRRTTSRRDGKSVKSAPQAEIRRRYLETMQREWENIPLHGLDTDASDPERARKTSLSGIYIDLLTTALVREEISILAAKRPRGNSRRESGLSESKFTPLPAVGAVSRHSRCVLLGAPGGGKSTCIRHLALTLARIQLAPPDSDPAASPHLPETWSKSQTAPIPILVVLRELAAWLADHASLETAESLSAARSKVLLQHFLTHQLSLLGLDGCPAALMSALEAGRALLLLDGLDEIPATGPRIAQVKALIEELATAWPKTPMVVTCRVLSWQDRRWQLGVAWKSFELAPLTEDQIQEFIDRWYRQLAASGHIREPEAKIALLQEAVQRPDLAELAGNPLLLTVMALLHGHRGELPDSKVLLYEETVDLLLQRWEKTNKPHLDPARALQSWLAQAGSNLTELKRCLSKLAFEAHQRGGERQAQGGESTADLPEQTLKLELARLQKEQSLVWAQTGLELIQERAGLLVESQPGTYHFPHRTFQEYLAGRHLSEEDFVERAARLMSGGTYWWEAILLAVSRFEQVGIGREQALSFVAELLPNGEPTTEDGWRSVWLAGKVLLTVRKFAETRRQGKDLIERNKTLLVRLLETGALSAVERCAAGLVLGHLGDPRLGLEKPENWIWIPPGEFRMGADDISDREKPIHKVTLTHGFYISRFPVTNHDFKAFVDAGGYAKQKWWSEEGWAFCQKGKREAPDYWTDAQWNAPNQPVVGVSWYEADAFCRWMNAQRLSKGVTGPFRLPTEAEWEYAARGQEGQKYPWGNDELTPERANYVQTGLGQTSPVGAFPLGASKDGATGGGVLDLSGNVLEWCGDWYGPYSSDAKINPSGSKTGSYRVLRGGSWILVASFLRGANRNGFGPSYRSYYVGFRVVWPASRGAAL